MRFMAKQWRTSVSSATHKYLTFNTKRYEKREKKLNNKKRSTQSEIAPRKYE